MKTHCQFCHKELTAHDESCPYWQAKRVPDRNAYVLAARTARDEANRTGSTLDDLAAVLAERNLCIFDANEYAANYKAPPSTTPIG